MRLFVAFGLCVLAIGLVSCEEPSGEYLPPNEVNQEYIPPAVEEVQPAATLSDDGYRYKAVKRLKFRHRRDVSDEYLPPVEEESDVLTYNEALGPVPADAAPAHTLSNDGYRYKALKRNRARNRRDVSELNNEYLPPTEVNQEYLPPTAEEQAPVVAEIAEAEPAHNLADDGYRYKAVKRYRLRHRRDVSELNNEYLPPVQQEQSIEIIEDAPAPVEIVESEPAHTLADDGYRYKAVKRYRFRHRRDVSELSNEYLPPVQQEQAVEIIQEAAPAPVEAAPAPVEIVEPEPAHTLADDGYRYKAVKRYRFRHRRDVSELSNEYLPPVQQEQSIEVVEDAPAPVEIVESEPAHTLADDGYRYKAVKRYRLRHRRDVNELSNEYLPPVQQEQAVEVVEEAAPAPIEVAEPEPAHNLADDGYRYKAVKRYRLRHRRDVNELSNEYLPPVQQEQAIEVVEEAAPAPIEVAEPEPAHTLADDGYRYKAVKRYRLRHRRDVNELSNEYLPPVQQEQAVEVVEEAAPAPIEVAEPEPAHTLADDGYRYKAVKRYRLRHRRDVNELSNEYLPPVQQEQAVEVVEEAAPAPIEIVEPEPAHTLADDGYRYKAVKRYRFRHRRDVSELSSEYLPPTTQQVSQEYLPPTHEVQQPEPAHSLADDGYRYKAIRRVAFKRLF